MNEPAEKPPGSSPPSSGVGRRLVAAREKWGLSVQEAAQCLNLSPAIITALEEESYGQMAGPTFALGYLRAYAKLLKLDPEEIIAGVRFEEEEDNKIQYASVPLKRTILPVVPKKGSSWLFRGLLIAVVLAVVAAASQLSGFGVDSLLEKIKFSLQADYQKKSNEVPLSSE